MIRLKLINASSNANGGRKNKRQRPGHCRVRKSLTRFCERLPFRFSCLRCSSWWMDFCLSFLMKRFPSLDGRNENAEENTQRERLSAISKRRASIFRYRINFISIIRMTTTLGLPSRYTLQQYLTCHDMSTLRLAATTGGLKYQTRSIVTYFQ